MPALMNTEKNVLLNRKICNLLIIVIPVLIAAYALMVRHAGGPFWLGGNFDPEYAYLMNSLNISQGLKVVHADHPGSTLQLLESSLLFLVHFFSSSSKLVDDVLMRPEFYLSVMYIIFIIFLFIALLSAGYLTYRWTNDIIGAILMQIGILFSYTLRFYVLSRMSPEILLLILSILMAIVVLYHKHIIDSGSKDEPAWQYGVISGLGISLKITFAPLVLLPIFLIRRGKNFLVYIVTFVVLFFVMTANPLMNFKGFYWFLFGSLVARQGYNRPLVEGSSKIEAMQQGLGRLAGYSWHSEFFLLWLVTVFVLSAIVIYFVQKYHGKLTEDLFNKRLWWGLLVVIAFQFILVANGPGANYHYMTPSLGLIGLCSWLSWRWPQVVLSNSLIATRIYRLLYLSLIIAIMVFTIHRIPSEIGSMRKTAGEWMAIHKFKEDNNLLDMPTIYYFRSSDIAYALDFGSSLSARRFSNKLSDIYKSTYMFNIWNNSIYGHFGSSITSIDDIINDTGSVLIQGFLNYYPLIPGLDPLSYPVASPGKSNLSRGSLVSKQELSAEVLFKGKYEWLVLVTK